jgi:hypothetical protein
MKRDVALRNAVDIVRIIWFSKGFTKRGYCKLTRVAIYLCKQYLDSGTEKVLPDKKFLNLFNK